MLPIASGNEEDPKAEKPLSEAALLVLVLLPLPLNELKLLIDPMAVVGVVSDGVEFPDKLNDELIFPPKALVLVLLLFGVVAVTVLLIKLFVVVLFNELMLSDKLVSILPNPDLILCEDDVVAAEESLKM